MPAANPLDPFLSLARDRGPIAPAVMAVLERQNRAWGPSARRDEQLEALRRGAAVVVTGQQLGVALGPLYTLYKAATAVRLAHALTDAGTPAVPIFWLQAEDHDFDEIRFVRFAGVDGPREVSLPPRPAERARASLAHERVGDGIRAVLEALAEPCASPRGAALLARLAHHYRPEALLVDAFGGLLTELFEAEGLLTIQVRDAALAPLAAGIHRRVITEHDAVTAALAERARHLEVSGARAPIPIRRDCALSFFHPDGPQGPRYRLQPRGPSFGLSGTATAIDAPELLRRLEHSPIDFSSSALLRVVIQDHLLPTVAYVGGPAEVAYAAQLEPLYSLLNATMAPFVRRASFLVTEARDRDDLAALSLSCADLHASETTLLQRLGRGATSDALEAIAAATTRSIGDVRAALAALDPGLDKTAVRTVAAIEDALGKLQARAERAGAARHPELVARLRRVRAVLRPGGAPQERVYGLPALAHLGSERIVAAALEGARWGTGAEVELAL